jgi:oligopeptide transport system ATP-binding protein
MYKGEIVELGPLLDTMREPLHPYTEMLLDSLLTIDEAKTSVSTTKIIFDSMYENDPNYCKYVSNCKYAFDKCRKQHPALIQVGNGRFVACHKFS